MNYNKNRSNIIYYITIIVLTSPIIVLTKVPKPDGEIRFQKSLFKDDLEAAKLPPDASGIDFITKNGYPLELHQITTEDNYILTAFRIPCGRRSQCNGNSTSSKPPVFVLHAFGQSSDVWVHNSRLDNALGFVLADAGFDVWLGNIRGNIYSNKHLFLSNSQPAYYNYSMDEFGKYDIPATIKYILEKTGKPKLHYIGYSSGNTLFYLTMARYPELSDKIALHISYGPSVFFGNLRVGFKLAASFANVLQLMDAAAPASLPVDGLHFFVTKIAPVICNPMIDIIGLCRFILFYICGFSPNHISREQMPSILGQGYAPQSMKVMVHIFQLVNNGDFTMYDYGAVGNIREYGQINAPHYNLQQITAPVVIMQAPSDIYAKNESSERLARNLRNLVEYYVIPNNEFSHVDFCFSHNANILVYRHTVELLNRFS